MSRVTHDLKCSPPFFQDVMDGAKPFEYRKNDRDFKCGDQLHLIEWRDDFAPTIAATGREGWFDVTYILYGGHFGIPKGYCIMALRRSHP